MAELTPEQPDPPSPTNALSTLRRLGPFLIVLVVSLVAVALLVLIVQVVKGDDPSVRPHKAHLKGNDEHSVKVFVSVQDIQDYTRAAWKGDQRTGSEIWYRGGFYLPDQTRIEMLEVVDGVVAIRIEEGDHRGEKVYAWPSSVVEDD